MLKTYKFTCDDSYFPIVKAMMKKELGISPKEKLQATNRFISMKNTWRQNRGVGFGNEVFRADLKRHFYQVSFDKPCEKAKILKSKGFRWFNTGGWWEAPICDEHLQTILGLGIDEVPSVGGNN
jgi:hypothetical protein